MRGRSISKWQDTIVGKQKEDWKCNSTFGWKTPRGHIMSYGYL
jgi:hypothetical protein